MNYLKTYDSKSLDPEILKDLEMNCTFYNQCFMSFMIFILEDRAVYNIESMVYKLKSSALWDNAEVKKSCLELKNNNRNQVKSGIIGRYIHRRNQMLSMQEQSDLADVCEVYDSVVRIQDRILRKMIREHVRDNSDCEDWKVDIVADIIMCIICCDMVDIYYKVYKEKPDYIKILFHGLELSQRPFAQALEVLNKLAYDIMQKTYSFTTSEAFDNAYAAYIKTIQNSERLMANYKKLNIEDSSDISYKGKKNISVKGIRIKNLSN